MKSFKSGQYVDQSFYKSFQPNEINRKWTIENMEILALLSKADRLIGKLDSYSDYIPNIELFISMHVYKEATKSNKIEGTKTNIEEALMDKEDLAEEKRDDWDEVQNYILAMNQAITDIKTLPFSSRLIKNCHEILLQGVRGDHKQPGNYRKSQNWIGGASIDDATFIPPIHTSVEKYMSDLEKFVHNEIYYFPELLKIALIHYQFETIHPFLDGNGRVGRLLITLYLVDKEILNQPILYLSDFFERNRSLYYDNLMRVREKNDISQWFKFFLVGVIETADNGIKTFDKILKLQKETDEKLQSLGNRAINAKKVVEYLYQKPLLHAKKVKEITGLTMPSVYTLLEELEKIDILKLVSKDKKGKLFVFDRYLSLFI